MNEEQQASPNATPNATPSATTSAPDSPAGAGAPGVGLREPAHRVSPRAVAYWRTVDTIGAVVVLAIAATLYAFFADGRWWATALLVVIALWGLVQATVAPVVRYRIHRWEVDDVAVHTRVGFINVESRIAPVNRIQTVDSSQGPVMRAFGLASVTVTTASSAGAIEIEALDADDAKQVVARLTAITAASEGDAT